MCPFVESNTTILTSRVSGGRVEATRSDRLVPLILETLAINQNLQLSDLIGRHFLSGTNDGCHHCDFTTALSGFYRAPVKSMPVDFNASVAS
jgi:hypothetical protein